MTMNTVEAMNNAFKADPSAFYALLCNRVPCNKDLAEDPFMVVERSVVLEGERFNVGALGIINGVLEANGLPAVAAMWEKGEEGSPNKLDGFCEYQPD